MKLQTSSASCACIACATAGKFIGEKTHGLQLLKNFVELVK
jgi:hypothetical protein